jgi:hypothetical protein
MRNKALATMTATGLAALSPGLAQAEKGPEASNAYPAVEPAVAMPYERLEADPSADQLEASSSTNDHLSGLQRQAGLWALAGSSTQANKAAANISQTPIQDWQIKACTGQALAAPSIFPYAFESDGTKKRIPMIGRRAIEFFVNDESVHDFSSYVDEIESCAPGWRDIKVRYDRQELNRKNDRIVWKPNSSWVNVVKHSNEGVNYYRTGENSIKARGQEQYTTVDVRRPFKCVIRDKKAGEFVRRESRFTFKETAHYGGQKKSDITHIDDIEVNPKLYRACTQRVRKLEKQRQRRSSSRTSRASQTRTP